MASPVEKGDLIDWRYRLGPLITSDATGDVFEAEQIRLSRSVAIKILPDEGGLESRERFLREANVLAKLDHPNIVFIIDFGYHEHRPYIVREQVQGSTLEAVLETKTTLPPEEAAQIILQIAEALEHAHQAGVVHRDLKPSNVLISEAGRVRLTDLGLAGLSEPGSLRLTMPGTVIGNSWTMSPEQARGEAADVRSDLYSLGALGYRMLTGQPPFAATTLEAQLAAHEKKEPPPPISTLVSLPAEANALVSLVERMLSPDPRDRPEGARQVVNHLKSASRDLTLPDVTVDAELLRSSANIVPPPLPVIAPQMSPITEPPPPPPALPPTPPPATPAAFEPSLDSDPKIPELSASTPSLDEEFDILSERPSWKPQQPKIDDLVIEPGPQLGFWARYGGPIKGVVVAVYFAVISGVVWFVAFGPPDAARDARALVRAGQTPNVIQQLDRWTKAADSAPSLHAALGYAWVYAKKPKRAISEYAAAAKDPSALQPADVAALASLLGVPDDDSLEAERILKTIPDRAEPWIESNFQRKDADAFLRCRSGDVLSGIGARVDFTQPCLAALETQSCSARRVLIHRFATLSDPRLKLALEKLANATLTSSTADCGHSDARAALQTWKPQKSHATR
jgi:serine/threonine protein kinase